MIVDSCIYNGEEELLKLRLETLRKDVDLFVLGEATRTFTGSPKALRFNAGAVPPELRDKLVHVVIDNLESTPRSPWDNEYLQRNALMRTLDARLDDADLVMLSDIDEIPRPASIREFNAERYISGLIHQRAYYYALNNLAVDASGQPAWWAMARITTMRRLRRWFKSMQSLRGFRAEGRTRSLKRHWNKLRTQHLADAGWHFSYLMSPEQILEKLQSFSHQEFNIPGIADLEKIREILSRKGDLLHPDAQGQRFRVVEVDDSFPETIVKSPAAFSRWIW